MLKKRQERPAVNETVGLTDQIRQEIILDYILAHAKNDTRPYLNVTICGMTFKGLLDSGATNTVIGGLGWRKLEQHFVLKKTVRSCAIANGDQCQVIGSIMCPLQLQDQVKVFEVLVVPSLPHLLILGMDFWRRMGIIPDMFSGEWSFRKETPVPQLSSLTAMENLSAEQRRQLDQLLDTAFAVTGNRLGCTHLVEHIITTNHPPIRKRHYPLSRPVQEAVNQELDEMLRNGVVEPSSSPWAFPIILLRKKDGGYRFVVDFRELNKVTERDAYPLPLVSATLDKLRNARFLSTIDIKSAYWQIPLAQKSRPLTAFIVPNRGLFQFCRMPMGLHNAPATWQRFIDRLFLDLEQNVLVYLDDVIICTNSFEEHLRLLKEVLDRLGNAGLTVNREKCHFCKSQLKYLGYVVGEDGLMVDPAKVEAILNIPRPNKVGDVRRLIGLASWYRRFISNFATLTAPLCELLRKNVKFNWTQACEAAFVSLKEHLVSAPILTCPDFDKPFVLQTDASDYGLGAVLSQNTDEGEKVICYLSRSLTKSERVFSSTEKECLAVIHAIEKLKPYLLGTKFTVITDHYSLKWLNNIKDPVGRIARWAVRLQQYDFDIIHRKGKEHAVPDALSRAVPRLEEIIVDGPTQDKWYNKMCVNVQEMPEKYSQWRLENGILLKKAKLQYPTLQAPTGGWLTVVPKEKRPEVIRQHHDPPTCGHLGIFKTSSRITAHFYWPKLHQDVAKYVRNCIVCICTKPEQRAPIGQMLSVAPTLDRPWKILSIDLVGPLPRSSSGYSYIFSVLDVFSKFILLFPLRQATASKVSATLENEVILLFGAPHKILMDNGVQFRSTKVRQLLEKYQILAGFISNYHPQGNPVERSHRVIKSILTAYVNENHRNWEKYLQPVAWAIRSAKHEVTQLTPNFVLFGRELHISGEQYTSPTTSDVSSWEPRPRSEELKKVYDDVSTRLKKAYERSRHRYNLRHRNETFKIGQKVWRRNYALSDATQGFTAKLARKFEGPFVIINIPSPFSYELADPINQRSCGVWHGKDLKSHPPDTE